MTTLTPAQVGSIRDLNGIWPNQEFTLIGALALTLGLPEYQRQTNDIDLSLILSPDAVRQRLAATPGWVPNEGIEHEWQSPTGVKVHVLPISNDALQAGYMIWPQSGRRMSLLGMRLSFEQRRTHSVAEGATIAVATVPCVIVLKVIAFLDRPRQRERDLSDFAETLERYVPDDDERRWAPETEGIDASSISAFLLGRDVGSIINSAERQAIKTFLGQLQEEQDGGFAQATILRLAPPSLRSRPDELLQRLEAFDRGLRGN